MVWYPGVKILKRDIKIFVPIKQHKISRTVFDRARYKISIHFEVLIYSLHLGYTFKLFPKACLCYGVKI